MFEQIKKLTKSQIKPITFLKGDEDLFIDLYADKIQSIAIPDFEKGFNETIVFGKDTNLGSVVDMAKRFPMMGENQLVLVKEAQDLAGWADERQAGIWEEYIKHPLASTFLVLCFHGKPDGRKAWAKTIGKQGYEIEFKKCYDNQLPQLVIDMVHSLDYKISPKAVQMMIEFVGNDLKKMKSEFDKLAVNLQKGEGIDAQHIQNYVGISKEYNVFEFQKALGLKDVLKAQQIAANFAANEKENPIQKFVGILYGYFMKVAIIHQTSDKSERNLAGILGVNGFFVKDYLMASRVHSLASCTNALHAIHELDLQSKGVHSGNATTRQILQEFVWKITQK